MKVVIDLDLHEAIQDFTIRSPAPAYSFKSQDTVEWELYYVKGGAVQDMGAGFAVKFGMIKTGDTSNTLLAYQTTFNQLTDVNGDVYYAGLVNFNTSQMATAIGTLPQINGTAEIRYQDSLNEIIHSLNISTIVYATIIVETGVTPPGVSTGYPDASTIELLVHKNVASGYAGLDSGAKINGAQIPVDGQTIQILDGQIAAASILAETAASFVTPAANATVSVTLISSTGLIVGQYVRLPIAGYYIVQSIPDGTHAVLQNNGDPFNAISGLTVPIDTPLLPAQAAAGGGGQGAFTTTTAGFTVPAVGATVQIQVASTAWMGGNGYGMFITGAGYYLVQSIIDSNNVIVTNSGSGANSPQGTVVASGARVSSAGPMGPAGAVVTGLSAYDTTTAAFTMPAAGANATVSITNTNWLGTNQVIYIAGAGYLSVAAISNATNFSATNLNYPGNAAAGTSIASGSRVSPGGLQGAQGAGGAGLNAYSSLTNSFTQPAVAGNVTINIGSSSWMAPGLGIFIQGGGYYTVSSIPDLTHVIVTNLGGPSNAIAGATVPNGGQVSPAGISGTNGVNAYTTTTASFIAPSVGSSVTISVGNTSWATAGQTFYIAGAGYYQVAAILNATQFLVTNLGYTGNASAGATIGSGTSVSPSGPIGPAGSPGPTGAAGRDGAFATIYTDKSIQGTGGVSSPATLVGDIVQASGAFQVYQRDSSGNSKWDYVPVDGTTVVISAGKVSSPSPQESLGAHIETPAAKTYTVDLAASSPYTIKAFKAILGAGTLTLALVQNGSNVSSAGSIAVSTTLSVTTLTQAVALNDKIQITLSSLASPTDLQFTMWIQR